MPRKQFCESLEAGKHLAEYHRVNGLQMAGVRKQAHVHALACSYEGVMISEYVWADHGKAQQAL